MALEFKARVLLELGAELISSDSVALYELVKNAIDAKSKFVEISVIVVFQPSALKEVIQKLNKQEANKFDFDLDRFTDEVKRLIEEDAPLQVKENFLDLINQSSNYSEAIENLRVACFKTNKIRIHDEGHGMSFEDLDECYLTIGTPNRLLEKVNSKAFQENSFDPAKAPPLGEKGIGRLSAMRLGHYISIKSATSDDNNWNILKLDFRPIFKDPSLNANALDYSPVLGNPKDNSPAGTTLVIRDLQSDWSEKKLNDIISGELAKLADPFDSFFFNDFFRIKFQGELITLPIFEKFKLKHADAICEAEFTNSISDNSEEMDTDNPLPGLELSVNIDYQRYGERKVKHLNSEHLLSCIKDTVGRKKKKTKANNPLPDSDAVSLALNSLGPFKVKFWWFNRGKIQKENNELWVSTLKQFVSSWSGGLHVYRNGFRVYPYGSPSDDWLDLDRNALAASQYKVNRAQIVGYLRITQKGNPSLQDQTNREGFRDCLEKEALKRLLRHIFITEFRTFLEDVDKKKKDDETDTVEEVEHRITGSSDAAVTTLKELQSRVPEETQAITEIMYQLGEIQDAWERAKQTIRSRDAELDQYIHLAGVGLQVEFIAHEIARVTDSSLDLLSKDNILNAESVRKTLEAQLKTLNKRVRVLDLLSIPGRQIRKSTYIEDIINLLCEFYENKIDRHGINVIIERSSVNKLKAKVEPGQIFQILDNLFNNSFYWLKNRYNREHQPTITIKVNALDRSLEFIDNGPGIPKSIAQDIFSPFMTTKPIGEGRGLGLFISQKLAAYNDAVLSVGPIDNQELHHSFVLSFKNTPEN